MNNITSWPSSSRKYSATVSADRPTRSARAGRLVHLAVDERGLGDDRLAGRQLGMGHLVVEIASLARALAHAGEHREAAVLLGHVVDEFQDDDGLAHARAAEQPDFSAAPVGRQQVHDLDAGLEHLDLYRLIDELRRGPVDGQELGGGDRAALVDRPSHHVDDAPENLAAHRHHDGRAGILHRHAAHQAVGGVHGHAAHGLLAQVLRHLDDQVVGRGVDGRVAQG